MMPTFAEMYAFLKDAYLHSRLEGSPNCIDFPDYPQCVTQSSLDQLARTGIGFVSMYESRTGRVVMFDRSLRILNPDEPPAQIQRAAPHITHTLGK